MEGWINGALRAARTRTVAALAASGLPFVSHDIIRNRLLRELRIPLTPAQRRYLEIVDFVPSIATEIRTVSAQRQTERRAARLAAEAVVQPPGHHDDGDPGQAPPIRDARSLTPQNHDQFIQSIADGFVEVQNENVNPRYQPNDNRHIVSLRNPGYHPNLARVEDFWEGLVRRIRRVLDEHNQPHDRVLHIMVHTPQGTHSVHIRRDGMTGRNAARNFTLNDLTLASLNRVLETLSQSERNILLRDLTFQIIWYTNQEPAQHQRAEGPAIRGHGKLNCPKEFQHLANRTQWMPSQGGLCGLKVLVVGMDDIEKKERDRNAKTLLLRERTDRNDAAQLLLKAQQLREQLGIPSDRDYTTTDDFQLFVDMYPTWRVVCHDQYQRPVPGSPWTGAAFHLPEHYELEDDEIPIFGGRTIYVLHVRDHFARIPNHNASNFRPMATNRAGDSHNKTCPHCLEKCTRETFYKHTCPQRKYCRECKQWMSEERYTDHRKQSNIVEQKFLCPKCGCKCGSQECMNWHSNKCSVAGPHCYYCKKRYESEEDKANHTCKTLRCNNVACRQRMDKADLLTHRCYMRPLNQAKKGKGKRNASMVEDEAYEVSDGEPEEEDEEQALAGDLRSHWAWDIETMTVDGEQVPNYIVAINLGDVNRQIATATMADFVDQAIVEAESFGTRMTFWAHNGAKFDTRFVYNYARGDGYKDTGRSLIKSSDRHPGTVFAGNKLFELRLDNITFRDSLLHLNGKTVADLPKTFGINTREICEQLGIPELKKGTFPYTFNIPENQNYRGPLPPIEYYGVKSKKPRDPYDPREDDAEGVVEWWSAENDRLNLAGLEWDFQHELKEYCRMDVLILRQALIKWQELNEGKNCNPLLSLTLPGHAHRTFRTKDLKPDTIPVLRAYPDFATPSSYRDKNLLAFDEERLCRDSYLGGNTNARRMLLELSEEEMAAGHRINMYDFRSQYPSAMVGAAHPYPVGDYQFHSYYPADDQLFQLNHPGEQYRPAADAFQPTREFIDSMHGVICCEIFYPTSKPPLFHPILPVKVDGKLTFSLREPTRTLEDIAHWEYRRCNEAACVHCNKFRGQKLPVYTLVEVHKALEVGYEMRHVYWILGTTETSTDLFASYVARNYGLKAKHSKAPDAAGWDWNDPRNQEEYVRRHAEIGIEVAPAEGSDDVRTWHQPEPGLKQLGKLMANSGYGKFGENSYQDVTLIAKDLDQEIDIWYRADTGDIDIKSTTFFEGMTEFRTSNKKPGGNVATTNVLLASYVTAYGRLMLWDLCNKYGSDVLYHDTDSALIHLRPGVDPPKCGVFLGDLEEEISNAHAFVSTGPKSYSIKYWDTPAKIHYTQLRKTPQELEAMDSAQREALLTRVGQGAFRWHNGQLQFEHVKQRAKGIVLTSENAKILNYECMKRMVQAMCGELDLEGDARAAAQREDRLKSLDFIWKRDVLQFIIREGTKTVRAEARILKGDLAGYYLMPFGWRRWDTECTHGQKCTEEECIARCKAIWGVA